MAGHPSSQSPPRNRWHGLIEHYTPSGVLGRLLVAIPSGPIGVILLALSISVIALNGLLWLPLALVLAGVGLAASILTVVVLWPVYLSLIGNIESTKTYLQTETTPSEEHRDDSIAVVKQQYAAGNISETEFERRIENLLHADAEFGSQSGTTSYRDERGTIRETD